MKCQTGDTVCWRDAQFDCEVCRKSFCCIHIHIGTGFFCSKCYIEDGMRMAQSEDGYARGFLALARLATREAELFESKAEYAKNKAQDKGPAYEDASRRYENEAILLRTAIQNLVPHITGG